MNSSNIELLFKAHISKNDELFNELALNLIKEEEMKNHHLVANRLKKILENDNSYINKSNLIKRNLPPIPRDNEKGFPLLEIKKDYYNWNDLIVDSKLTEILKEVVRENKKSQILASYGLKPKNKILLSGPPGTGKTLTAKILSSEMNYPLLIVRFDSVISSFLGETSSNLRKIFDYIEKGKWVVLFDEFDIIGKKRDDPTEHGEIKRVVNNFMLMLENYTGDSILLASSNHPQILDEAVWRRFDEVLIYYLPDVESREKIFKKCFKILHRESSINYKMLAEETEGFSGSDIEQVSIRAMKNSLLDGEKRLSQDYIEKSIQRQKDNLRFKGSMKNGGSFTFKDL
ncbi:ATP-binding protein [Methanoplanus sp. FWC-SCC4]|uniref:ATP-binding protein n=1 Tax=Methanochimaera problematica TaxID=2609417 RepID=A0AA97FDV9_9EURY|nr:ATP-binding protein [Methanoplanus sp. FWC-SCC4]WOF17257.1 ATP-binding protein [Methanoplanus sp. FWC-SCC4]